MRISLVSPPTTVINRYPKNHPLRKATQVTEPLGLGYLASMVEDLAEVQIVDCIAEDLDVHDCVQRVKYSDFVGISAVTSNIHVVNHLVCDLKKENPGCTVILGGIHPSLCPDEIMLNENVDIIVIGEGEITLRKIICGVSLSNIPGIVYRQGSRIHRTIPDPLETDLDRFHFPARHLLKMELYHPFLYLKRPVHSIISSRGCPFQCTYCCRDISGQTYRLRDPEKVVEEIKLLVEKYGAREVAFQDPVFGLRKKWVTKFCELMFIEKMDVVWSALTRVNLVTHESLQMMKDAGCWMIYYGVEAGSQTLLNNIKKGTSLHMIKRAVDLTASVGIKSWGSFMFALPGEDPLLARATLDFAKRLPFDFVSFHLTTPFLGTELRKTYEQWGTMSPGFSDFTQLHPVFIPYGWKGKEEELKTFFTGAFREFYLRPGYVLRQLLKIRSWDEVKMYARGLKVF